jgi:hypothetical protein
MKVASPCRNILLAVVAALALSAPAEAAVDQESLMQDDPKTVYATSDLELATTLAKMKALGVDRVRVSVFWNLIAPAPNSRTRPDFGPLGPAWPGSYDARAWDRYDRLVKAAANLGLGLLFTVTGPAPAWATSGGPARPNSYRPDPQAFRDFVTAVGLRYSGRYPDEPEPAAAQPGVGLGGIELGGGARQAQQPGAVLPRVGHWSLWNEPNFPSWLSPVWQRVTSRDPRRMVPYSPLLYRRLVNASWNALRESGHGDDVILLGETAPRGNKRPRQPQLAMKPGEFIRELYCLDPVYRPWTGSAARKRRCPQTARGRRRFARDNPGLFNASGWAHHPYPLNQSPIWGGNGSDSLPLGGMRRLHRAFERLFFRWGAGEPFPVWITEMGFQTQPDPYVAVGLGRQAAWNTWSEEIAYRDRRVASTSQFQLIDDGPDTTFAVNDPRRWRSWQSGLEYHTGGRKPAWDEYIRPIRVSPGTVRRGSRVRLFSLYRPAAPGAAIPARIEYKPAGSGWRVLRRLTVRSPMGYMLTRIRVNRTMRLRVVWTDPRFGYELPTRGPLVRVR